MKKLMRNVLLLLAVSLLATCVSLPMEANAAVEYYNSYSDVDKITDYGSCGSMQGLAVGSQKLYSVKINSSDSQAFIAMTDKDTGETVKLYNSDADSYYFSYLGHANDMDVTSFDGKSHLFIATMKTGSNAIVRLKRSGNNVTKVASYSLSYKGNSVSASGIAIKSSSNGVITFITKSGTNVYTGSVSSSATSANIELSLLCVIDKSQVYINGQLNDLSDYTNQGMGYHDGVMYVPISGPSGSLNRSVIMVFNLDGVIPGSTIYPSEAISFRVTSSSYSSMFEIESCGICSSDGKLYFNTNRRKSTSDTNHDGVSWFKDYTFVKLTEPVKYHNFIVQYEANGGTGTMENSIIPYGVSTKLSANTYTRQGYHFVGWTAYRTAKDQWYYTNGTDSAWYAEGSQPSGYQNYIYADKQSVSKTSSVDGDTVVLYAQWEPNTYIVRYDANGGTGTMADTTVTFGVNSALRKNAFTRDGYTFAGWVAYRSAEDQWRYANPSGTGSAWYKEGTQPEGYTLYVYGDGVNVSKTTAVDGGVTTFYAQWTPNAYTVTFRNEDGTVLQSSQVAIGDTPTPPDAPTKEQNGCTVYIFAGWDQELAPVSGEATYTATYTEAVRHNWVDGTCTTPKTCQTCGATEGSAPGHSYDDGNVIAPPTCTEDGTIEYACTVCGDSYSEDIPAFGHSYGTKTTPPTCTKSGYTTYICGFCSDEYVADEVAALGHSYVDGTCTACGAADPDYVKPVVKPNLTLSYPTLNFKDVVYYNVYYQVSNMTDVVEMGLITFDGALSTGTIDDAAEVITGYVASGSNYMVHTNGINAKNLGDALYFKVYAKLSDGSYVYSDLAGYHAVAYAKDILANSTNAKMKSLVVAMLNYGAAAQVQFEYKTDNLMNSFLSDEQKALVSEYSADMVAPVTKVDSTKVGEFAYVSGGYSALYPSVSFEGAFSVKFYFTPAKAMDGDLTMYYWSAADYAAADVLTAENATGVFTMDAISGTYVATVEGIAARQIDETIYVAGIYESNGVSYPTGVIAYSLGTYCLDRVANGTGNMPAFAKATIVYGNYAKAYFA